MTRSSRQLSRSISGRIPGNGGEPNEGPGSYEEQQFAALAYPAADIPQAALAGAKSAAAEKKGKFGTGKGQKGQWISVGPTEALYPATELRNSFSYVPNAYVAGGRTTVLAIAPTCKPGHCRLWVGRGRRRYLDDQERAERPAELGLPLRLLRDPGGQLDHRRPERPVG